MEGDLEDLILIRVLHRGLFLQDRIGDLRNDAPLETGANRSAPMACEPNVDQACPACGGSGAPRRGPWLARETPAGCPRQASPAGAIALLGGALAGSGPGHPLYRRAVLASGMVIPQRCAC